MAWSTNSEMRILGNRLRTYSCNADDIAFCGRQSREPSMSDSKMVKRESLTGNTNMEHMFAMDAASMMI